VAIAVDRYVCICHPLQHATVTSATTRARLVVIILAAVAIVLGLLGATSFSVYHSIPVIVEDNAYVTQTSPPDDDDQPGTNRPPGFIFDDEADDANKSCATGTRAKCRRDTISHAVINTGYCGQSYIILSATFLHYYNVIHSLIYPFCLLTVLVLYSLIYRTVLDQRARRLKMHAAPVIALVKSRTSPAANSADDTGSNLIIVAVAVEW